MKALNFITAAVAFVATLTMVGCGDSQDELKARQGLVLVKFEPKDELDKVALATAQEKYPDKTFYRFIKKTMNHAKKPTPTLKLIIQKAKNGCQTASVQRVMTFHTLWYLKSKRANFRHFICFVLAKKNNAKSLKKLSKIIDKTYSRL